MGGSDKGPCSVRYWVETCLSTMIYVDFCILLPICQDVARTGFKQYMGRPSSDEVALHVLRDQVLLIGTVGRSFGCAAGGGAALRWLCELSLFLPLFFLDRRALAALAVEGLNYGSPRFRSAVGYNGRAETSSGRLTRRTPFFNSSTPPSLKPRAFLRAGRCSQQPSWTASSAQGQPRLHAASGLPSPARGEHQSRREDLYTVTPK